MIKSHIALFSVLSIAVGLLLTLAEWANAPTTVASPSTVKADLDHIFATTRAALCEPTWEKISSPNIGTSFHSNYLFGVSVVSPNDIWAIGSNLNFFGRYSGTETQHWDGQEWSIVPSPQEEAQFSAVAGISTNNVWAVGWQMSSSYIAHWDGLEWVAVPHPDPDAYNRLYAVEAISPDDIWAVGETRSSFSQPARTMILHWNGQGWSIVPSPNPGAYNELRGVVALAANDVWAVGNTYVGSAWRTLTLHWDGTEWRAAPSPNMGERSNYLRAIDALPSGEVWAVGYYYPQGSEYPQTLTLRWNGTQWSIVSSPNVGNQHSYLNGVAALASGEVWAVGSYWSGTLTIRWNGSAWGIVPSPVRLGLNELTAVTASPDGTLWAVGYEGPADGERTLIMRYGGQCVTPTPTATGTPPTATNTRTATVARTPTATNTRTATRTPTPTLTRTHTTTATHNVVYTRTPNSTATDTATTINTATRATTSTNVPVPTATAIATATATNLPGSSCLPWHFVFSPNPRDTGRNVLYDVEAITHDDVWAVGENGGAGALIMHWDGTRWDIMPSPTENGWGTLYEIDALARDDIWVAGTIGWVRTLILHWDGTEWSVVPSPNSQNLNLLYSVSAVSPTDAWAVGYTFTSGSGIYRALIMRWDGEQWSMVSSPSLDNSTTLWDIEAISRDDVWAVGTGRRSGTNDALILHWDGSRWNVVPSFSNGWPIRLSGVSARASDDIWVVGTYEAVRRCPLLLHWDGAGWNHIDVDCGENSPSQLYGYLNEVVALASNNVWVVGSDSAQCRGCARIYHWNGITWSIVPNLGPDTTQASLWGITLDNRGSLWAVGEFAGETGGTVGDIRTLTMRYDRGIIFSDAFPNDYFYTEVNALYCQGAISGYVDNTFRPNNPSTRGQTAKIISLAFGFGGVPTVQTFEDVPANSTFYSYIEWMVERGILGGYPCGGELEPCIAPQNRPYFRPNSNVTRGQASKIVANSAGFSETPTGQTFEDVPPSSPFHTWIEQLASRGVIGGYPCGGYQEPCGTTNRPYFRFSKDITRGQLSRITVSSMSK